MIKSSVLVSAALAAAIASGASLAADAPPKPDVAEMKAQMAAITSVQSPAGQVDALTGYCAGRFTGMSAEMAQVAGEWHARNGSWEKAAGALRPALRERMVAFKMVDDAATFDRTLDGILQGDVARMRAKFDGMASDEERGAACVRFREAVDGGRFDVETLWPNALSVLRPYLK